MDSQKKDTGSQKSIIFVTCTYKRTLRYEFFQRHINFLFSKIKDYYWIVVEDGESLDPKLQVLISQYNAIYLNCGPSNDKGHAQRNMAYEFIRDNKIEGVVYNLDDDNLVYAALCEELRKVGSIAVFPVGNLGNDGIERAIVNNKQFVRWCCGWLERRYPVDMGGFAFSSNYLFDHPSPIWFHRGIGGESEFIESLIKSIDEIDFSLCHWNYICLVFHNEPLDN